MGLAAPRPFACGTAAGFAFIKAASSSVKSIVAGVPVFLKGSEWYGVDAGDGMYKLGSNGFGFAVAAGVPGDEDGWNCSRLRVVRWAPFVK
jgi:hypothetical protein